MTHQEFVEMIAGGGCPPGLFKREHCDDIGCEDCYEAAAARVLLLNGPFRKIFQPLKRSAWTVVRSLLSGALRRLRGRR